MAAAGDAPRIEIGEDAIAIHGCWTLPGITPELARVHRELAAAPERPWRLEGLSALDTYGALLLWRKWGRKLPAGVEIPKDYEGLFARLGKFVATPPQLSPAWSLQRVLAGLGRRVLDGLGQISGFITLLGQLVIELAYLIRTPRAVPWLEISANIYKAGVKAMPVTALVAFLIGVVLSYLFALQLKRFGAEAFIVDVLGIDVIRELGPVLVATLVAGRSGSAMTAQLGTMRVTEEIDALATMGVPRHLRLVFPKVMALAVAMPLLVGWTCLIALAGGMIAAYFELGLDFQYFISNLPRAVPLPNLWIAAAKGVAFGITIALVACHFGLRVKPNTESLSHNTTDSVVSAITVVILLDAVFALATRNVGLGRG